TSIYIVGEFVPIDLAGTSQRGNRPPYVEAFERCSRLVELSLNCKLIDCRGASLIRDLSPARADCQINQVTLYRRTLALQTSDLELDVVRLIVELKSSVSQLPG